ncbi:MAG TPA: hypothetical protein VFG00_09410, partial [Acidothermaceae bacterium]|nr:hypothetical protein [Acidothermaceae bacterium]
GHGLPESHWFGSVVLRDAWEAVRERLGETVTSEWKDATAAGIFDDNARELYRLPEVSARNSR